MLDGGDLDLVAIATPHDSHAQLVVEALRRDVAVYVEKPLALDWEQLAAVRAALEASAAPLFVGFNRRYAPAARELKLLPGPRLMHLRVNSGPAAARALDQRPRARRRATEGGGLSLRRFPLRSGEGRPGQGHRLRLRLELGAVARRDRQLQPADPVQRRQRRDDQLRG